MNRFHHRHDVNLVLQPMINIKMKVIRIRLVQDERNPIDSMIYLALVFLLEYSYLNFLFSRRRRNTNASQNGAENSDRPKSEQTKKPKDDEAIVKLVLRSIVGRVARRVSSRYRRRSRGHAKETVENNANASTNNKGDGEQKPAQTQPRHAGRGRPPRRLGNGYFIETGTK